MIAKKYRSRNPPLTLMVPGWEPDVRRDLAYVLTVPLEMPVPARIKSPYP
jgi:hypothetical protein